MAEGMFNIGGMISGASMDSASALIGGQGSKDGMI